MAKNRLVTFWKNNSLSIVMFGLFFAFLCGLAVTGFMQENEELIQHHQPAIALGKYLLSGSFVEAVFENWESEFLQMWALVVLSIVLHQKGAADSKKLRGPEAVDRPAARHDLVGQVYSHSLGLALLGLFIVSFALHALGGAHAANEEAAQHGAQLMSVWQYLSSSRFWFESFQNWQSEFLSVGSLLVLSVFLRERGSSQSKPVDAPNDQTGSS